MTSSTAPVDWKWRDTDTSFATDWCIMRWNKVAVFHILHGALVCSLCVMFTAGFPFLLRLPSMDGHWWEVLLHQQLSQSYTPLDGLHKDHHLNNTATHLLSNGWHLDNQFDTNLTNNLSCTANVLATVCLLRHPADTEQQQHSFGEVFLSRLHTPFSFGLGSTTPEKISGSLAATCSPMITS